MKRILLAGLTLLLIFLLTSCFKPSPNERFQIVTTIFPQYDFTREVVGDLADIVMLLLPGQDTHSYDPSTQDIIAIKKADLFIYTGEFMEVWAKNIIDSLPKSVKVLDVSKGIKLSIIDHDDEEMEDDLGHSHHYDPHIWTDPLNAKIIVKNIRDKMMEIDPKNSEIYQANATNYLSKLDDLNTSFLEVIENRIRDTIYFAAPFAFHYFVERYQIKYKSLYHTCSTETDPSIDEIILFIKEISENNIPVIYTKELLTNTVASKIQKDTNAEIVLLHSAHNISKEDFNEGITYLDIMQNNVLALMRGLQ